MQLRFIPRFFNNDPAQYPQDPHDLRVRMLLAIGTVALLLMSIAWGVYYLVEQKWVLMCLHLSGFCLGILVMSLIAHNRVRLAAIIMAHALLVIINAISLLDTPSHGGARSVHMFFLPVAAAATLAFRKDNMYLRAILPLLMLVGFMLYGPTHIGIREVALLPPADIVPLKVWINYIVALILLGVTLLVMQTDITIRNSLYADIRAALIKDEFCLYYQPQVSATGTIFGAEALLRWKHPTRGMIAPGTFIGVAEETGLIHPIGVWVLKKACEQLVIWSKNPLTADLTISVNVSALQLRQPDFVQEVIDIVSRSGAPASKLKLELTESIFATDVAATTQKMKALCDFGIRWALDDFGTGYSSLNYLKHLPFEQLKIDQSFVRDLQTNQNDKAIVRTLIVLSKNLNMMLIAEGVETTAQLDMLLKKGCMKYQGYLFSRPLPMPEFESFLTTFTQSTAYTELQASLSRAQKAAVPPNLPPHQFMS
jgi:EAL domain-containing protein (putative c-di-GMP-specific phosphodiesterase class I)